MLAVYQGLWNWVLSSRAFVDTRVSYNSIDFPLQLKTTQQTLADITFNPSVRTRANAANQVMFRERIQVSSNWQYFIPQWVGGRHEIRAGVDNAYTPDSVDIRRNDEVQLTYRSQPSGTTPAGAAQVILSNTPLFQQRAVMNTALYLQDSYSRGGLTLVGGLRWERVEGWLPAQASPASPWFPEGMQIPVRILGQDATYTIRRSFDEVRNAPLWYHGTRWPDGHVRRRDYHRVQHAHADDSVGADPGQRRSTGTALQGSRAHREQALQQQLDDDRRLHLVTD